MSWSDISAWHQGSPITRLVRRTSKSPLVFLHIGVADKMFGIGI